MLSGYHIPRITITPDAPLFLDIDKTYESKDIYKDEFSEQIDVCTVIHVLEHLHDPLKFLKHVKNKIIKNNGYIYVEVPSAESSTYDDPTHLFMFTQEYLLTSNKTITPTSKNLLSTFFTVFLF